MPALDEHGLAFPIWNDLGMCGMWKPIETAPEIGQIVGGWRGWGDCWVFKQILWDGARNAWIDVAADETVKPETWALLPR